jgi:serine/threonine protein kinase
MDARQVGAWQNKMLGRYRLLRLLGRGGMGEVWLAEDAQLRRQVAVKLLPTVYASDRSYLEDFEREAQSAAALEHPHILPIHDFGEQSMAEDEVVTYLITPYISGGSLLERIRRAHGPLAPSEALSYLRQAAEAIDYAHSRNVLHRDIKPANMLLQPAPAQPAGDPGTSGTPGALETTGMSRTDQANEAAWLFLADFGIAKLLTSNTLRSRTYAGSGTPEYMAPEQAHGKAEPASDRYSFAMMAYQLCTGRVAFKGDTPYDTLIQQMTKEPPPPGQLNPALPKAVEAAILQGLAKQPGDRPPSCMALVEALERGWQITGASTMMRTELPATISALPSLPPLPPEPPQRRLSRRTLLISGAGAALIAAGGSTALYELWRSHLAPSHPVSQPLTQPRPSPGPGKLIPGVPLLSLTGHTQGVTVARWDPTGRYLATGGEDAFVMLWDLASYLQPGQASFQSLAAPARRWKLSSPIPANGVCWSADGQAIAIVTGENNIFLYKAFNSNGTLQIYHDTSAASSSSSPAQISIAWSPTANVFATPSYVQQQTQQQVDLWKDGSTNRPAEILKSDATGTARTLVLDYVHPYNSTVNVNMVGWSVDGSLLAGHTNFGTVTIWQVAAGAVSQVLDLPLRPTQQKPLYVLGECVAWSPTGPHLLAVSDIDVAMLWDVQQNRLLLTLKSTDPVPFLTGLSWAPNGKYLAGSYAQSPRIYVWDMQTATNPGQAAAQPQKLFFPQPGTHVHTATITDVAWSPDGRYIATASGDTTVVVWRVDAS